MGLDATQELVRSKRKLPRPSACPGARAALPRPQHTAAPQGHSTFTHETHSQGEVGSKSDGNRAGLYMLSLQQNSLEMQH